MFCLRGLGRAGKSGTAITLVSKDCIKVRLGNIKKSDSSSDSKSTQESGFSNLVEIDEMAYLKLIRNLMDPSHSRALNPTKVPGPWRDHSKSGADEPGYQGC